MSSWPSLVTEQITGEYPDSTSMQRIMRNLQANILKPHGRDRAYHIFLRFKKDDKDIGDIKKWIKKIADKYVTSAQKQFEDSLERRKNPRYSGGLIGCFFLSVQGYELLFPKATAKKSTSNVEVKVDKAFKHGMKYRYEKEEEGKLVIKDENDDEQYFTNKDPEPDADSFYAKDIHAMLLLARDCHENDPSLEESICEIFTELRVENGDKKEIGKATRVFEQLINNKEKTSCSGFTKVIDEWHFEYGQRLLSPEGYHLEHFGFRDGISNPLLFKEDIDAKKGKKFNPGIPLDKVIIKDPFLPNAEDCYGSYFVFRKLVQDRKGFEDGIKELQKEGIHGGEYNQDQLALIEAQVLGRFKDGTAVINHKKPQGEAPDMNDFDYKKRLDKQYCPFHAHIRRVNPRKGGTFDRPIVRRGMSFGKPSDRKTGMLFMCYQSSIQEQFEFIQRVWIDDIDEPKPASGIDALVGQKQEKDQTVQHQWYEKYPDGRHNPITHRFFGGHVTLEGGEYFFAPSLKFLQTITDKKRKNSAYTIEEREI